MDWLLGYLRRSPRDYFLNWRRGIGFLSAGGHGNDECFDMIK